MGHVSKIYPVQWFMSPKKKLFCWMVFISGVVEIYKEEFCVYEMHKFERYETLHHKSFRAPTNTTFTACFVRWQPSNSGWHIAQQRPTIKKETLTFPWNEATQKVEREGGREEGGREGGLLYGGPVCTSVLPHCQHGVSCTGSCAPGRPGAAKIMQAILISLDLVLWGN